MELITSLVQKLRWGPQVLAVKLAKDLGITKSIFTQSHALSVNDFKLQTYKIQGGGHQNDVAIPVDVAANHQDLTLTDLNVTVSSSDDDKFIFMPGCDQR